MDQGVPPDSRAGGPGQGEVQEQPATPEPVAERAQPQNVVGRLRLGRHLYQKIIAHLQDQLPGEGCGLVAWQGDRAVHVYPGDNIHQRPATSYRMDERQVWRASEHMERNGWHLGAIYHSHPTTPPFPSPSDVANAWWTDVYTLIVSFRERTPELRAFLIDRVSASYQEVPVDVTPGERSRGWRGGLALPRIGQPPDERADWRPHSQTLPILPGVAPSQTPTLAGSVPHGSMLAHNGPADALSADPPTVEMILPMMAMPAADDDSVGVEDMAASAPWVQVPGGVAASVPEPGTSVRAAAAGVFGGGSVDTGGSEGDSDGESERRAFSAAVARHIPERRATIGILGGMGPLATADLYRKIIELTPANSDQEHIPVVIWADPRVPDRTEALLHDGEDPTPWLVRGAQALADMGADFIVIPCNTAHAFTAPLRSAVPRPLLSMIGAAADAIVRAAPDADTVGLLATSGTIAAELYQQALMERGRDVIVPDDDTQERCVMSAIRAVKAGRADSAATALMQEAAGELAARGAGALLAACTEIPLIFEQEHTSTILVDATAALAEAAVATAQYLDARAREGDPAWETTSGWEAIVINPAADLADAADAEDADATDAASVGTGTSGTTL